MLGTKMHRRSEAQCEILMQTNLCQHTYRETGIPFVGISHDEVLTDIALFVNDGLQTNILELNVL